MFRILHADFQRFYWLVEKPTQRESFLKLIKKKKREFYDVVIRSMLTEKFTPQTTTLNVVNKIKPAYEKK